MIRRFVLAVVAACIGHLQIGWAGELVRVTMLDGRIVYGNIDARSNEQFLWVGLRSNRIEFASKHAWDSVAEMESEGRRVSRAELLQSLAASPKQVAFDPSPWDELESNTETVIATSSHPSPASTSNSLDGVDLVPRSLIVRAVLGNWDADPRPDGLVVELVALNRIGRPVPFQGHVDLRLVVAFDDLGSGIRNAIPPQFRVVEHRSVQVSGAEISSSGTAIVRLPFRQETWITDVGIAPIGLVHARLSIPSVGVFEATDDTVILKDCNPLRDQMHYYLGNRYLPAERSGY